MLFKRIPFSAPKAEQALATPGHERIDELYGFMEQTDRQRLRKIADTPREGAFSGAEALEINTIRARLEIKLANAGVAFTSTEIDVLFQTLVGSVEKMSFDEERFNFFQKHLGKSYFTAIEDLKTGVRLGRKSPEDEYKKREMRDACWGGVVEHKLPFTREQIDAFFDKLLEVEPVKVAEASAVPTFRAERPVMSEEGEDALANANVVRLRPQTVPPTPVAPTGVLRPDADLAPLSELGDTDKAVLQNLGVSLEEANVPKAVSSTETSGFVLQTEEDAADFVEGFKAVLADEGLLQEPPSQTNQQKVA